MGEEVREAGIFFSLVGKQPGSVACPATVLVRAGAIRSVVLISTSHTQSHAEKLREYFRALPGLGDVQGVPLTSDKDVDTICDILCGSAETRPDLPIYLNVSSGPSYVWGKISLRLKHLPGVFPIYSEQSRLFMVGGSQSWPLGDLGLDTLLALHGLAGEHDGTDMNGVARNLRLMQGTEEILRMDWAYERWGRFYALWEDVGDLQAMRNIIGQGGDKGGLNSLHIQKTVTTDYQHIYTRAIVNNIEVMQPRSNEEERDKLTNWKLRHPAVPGRAFPSAPKKAAVSDSVRERFFGAGGDGASLLVGLGNDASSTLAAIYAHRPSWCGVLYDSSVPFLKWLAGNLAACAEHLPLGQLELIPLPDALAGKGIDNSILPAEVQSELPVLANITPGTKAQTYAFGRLDGVRLCSIHNKAGQVMDLESNVQLGLACNSVPTGIAGLVQGGPGASCRLQESDLVPRMEFLSLMLRAVAAVHREKGKFFLRKNPDKVCRAAGYEIRSAWQDGFFQIQVRGEGRTAEGSLPAPKIPGNKSLGGDWFEDLVAAAFFQAGATDLWVGMKWPWGTSRRRSCHRTEIDVVFPWHTHHVVVSVKAYDLAREGTVEEKSMEVRAMANECFGRLSLPVLVHFKSEKHFSLEGCLEELRRDKVLVIGPGQLSSPAGLKALIDSAFERQRSRF